MGVVTVSAAYGAGGAEVAPAVAERLGLAFVDRAIPAQVAGRLGVPVAVAEAVMSALEETARRAGHRRVVLNTGPQQPEALGLYAALGYRPVPGFGVYACVADAVFLGKDLGASCAGSDEPTDGEERSWAS